MRLDGRSPHCAIGFITVVQGNATVLAHQQWIGPTANTKNTLLYMPSCSGDPEVCTKYNHLLVFIENNMLGAETWRL